MGERLTTNPGQAPDKAELTGKLRLKPSPKAESTHLCWERSISQRDTGTQGCIQLPSRCQLGYGSMNCLYVSCSFVSPFFLLKRNGAHEIK